MIFQKCRTILRVWKYALGSFSDEKTERYDNAIVVVRSIVFFSYLITNCFIIAGVVRHWDSNQSVPIVSPHLDDGAILESNKRKTE